MEEPCVGERDLFQKGGRRATYIQLIKDWKEEVEGRWMPKPADGGDRTLI